MATQAASDRVRLGILALPVGAVLILTGTVIYGRGPESLDDLRAYAEIASSSRTAISNLLTSIGQLLVIFGFVALYACMSNSRAERWAFFAMVLCVPGIASSFAYWAGTSGLEAVAAEQYLEGQRAVLEEWVDLFDWSSLFLLILNPGLFSIGLILFGVAIWRSQTLPQGAAILWLAVILFLLATPLAWLAPIVSFLLLTIAGGWIAWSVWQRPSDKVAGPEVQTRVR
jgi:hypothetical protein